MKIGFDYWQVISHYPDYFRLLARMHQESGDQVYVVSAIGKDRAGTVADAVMEKMLGCLLWRNIHEVVFDHPSQSPELKLAKCQELGITVFYDDRDDVCRLLNKHGILAMRVTRRDNSRYDLDAERPFPALPENSPPVKPLPRPFHAQAFLEAARRVAAILHREGRVEGTDDDWQPYNGDYEKRWYDIRLKGGAILKDCYPNAGFFHPLGTNEYIGGDRVAAIRETDDPLMR